jgi:hypothetical protein
MNSLPILFRLTPTPLLFAPQLLMLLLQLLLPAPLQPPPSPPPRLLLLLMRRFGLSRPLALRLRPL